eukprot:10822784-Ditylum_brightwellii.AAC.1
MEMELVVTVVALQPATALQMMITKSKVEETKWKIRETMDTLSRKSSMTETVFGILGYSAPNFNVDE